MSKAGSRMLQGVREALAYARGADLPCFELRPLLEEEGGGYLIEFPDYPGCIADGETAEEAIREGRGALESHVKTLAADLQRSNQEASKALDRALASIEATRRRLDAKKSA